jgi:hypothetical protein
VDEKAAISLDKIDFHAQQTVPTREKHDPSLE